MGCGCKNEGNVGNEGGDENYNVMGNMLVKILLFTIAAIILPLALPVMWYFLFTKIFFDANEADFMPAIKALVGKLTGKKDDDDDDDDNVDMDGLDINELELVTKVDEIETK